MDTSLFATKLRVPPRTHHIVPRDRLVDALEREIAHHKCALVTAPAGYGKTTVLAEWARESRFSVAWLALAEEENDLERFFRYLYAAWETVQPEIAHSPLCLLLEATAPDPDAVLAAFVNSAGDLPDHAVIILDDIHLIDDPAIYRSLTFLLDQLPPNLHFVLAGRSVPPLPLARYRARRELLEIQVDHLRFSPEETEAFLRSATEATTSLAPDDITALHERLEGWVAGLQLVSLTLGRQPLGLELPVVRGRHRFITDYLSEEVLARLPAEVRRFLIETSILDRLSDSLCDAVTGRDGSQEMLDAIERANLFLSPLDDHREWYRYHPLFAEVLQEELQRHHPDEPAELHRRAATWYLAHDLPNDAFYHAVAGNDVELVTRILNDYVVMKLECGEFKDVERWLASIPEGWFTGHPVLGLAQVAFMVFSGSFDSGLRHLDRVEEALTLAQSRDTSHLLARVAVVRCAIACFLNDMPQAEAHAGQALRDLQEEDIPFRSNVYHALADTYRRNGRWDEARAHYLKVLELVDDPAWRIRSAHVFGALADLELRQGRLRDAAAAWQKALAVIEQRQTWGRLPVPVIGWVYLRMGELLYEWNDLPGAREHLTRGLERAEVGGDVRAMIAGYLTAARMNLTEGDPDAAATELERARPLVEQAAFPELANRFERIQLEIWLAQDRLRAAVTWADAMLREDALANRPERDVAQLAVARVLIVKGDAPSRARALAILDQLRQEAEAEGRTGVLIEALALRALASWADGEQAETMTFLEHALRLAEPEGYTRLFVDLGFPMGRLLQEARSRGVMPDYVEQLLAVFGADVGSGEAVAPRIPEPLTRREHEVLSLIVAGLTNREIADKLVVSPETVKKHTGSIYGKLGVSHRTEAVARARALDLVEHAPR